MIHRNYLHLLTLTIWSSHESLNTFIQAVKQEKNGDYRKQWAIKTTIYFYNTSEIIKNTQCSISQATFSPHLVTSQLDLHRTWFK